MRAKKNLNQESCWNSTLNMFFPLTRGIPRYVKYMVKMDDTRLVSDKDQINSLTGVKGDEKYSELCNGIIRLTKTAHGDGLGFYMLNNG